VIVIAQPYARYSRTLTPAALESAASRLVESADRTTRRHFGDRYGHFGITVVAKVEAGSTRTWVTIGSLVSLLNFYGNIRQSVDYLVKDARDLGTAILSEAPNSLGIHEHASGQQKRLGVPGQLRRLFGLVERGEISAEEATRRALLLLERRGGVEAMRELPRLTEQLSSELTAIEADRENSKIPAKREGHRPVLGLPPAPPRQRRRGAIASKDASTGQVYVTTY
jgi:hypothetical protein